MSVGKESSAEGEARVVEIELEGRPPVSGLLRTTPGLPRAVYVFAHGAGAGMRHAFMVDVASRLAVLGIATLRFQFPYMEAGKRAPDRPPLLMETVRAAVRHAARSFPESPLVAGGKSMGGRMTSLAAAGAPLPGVRGLAFFGFPLHAAGRDSAARGAHLAHVGLPMLFLQGTRDRLANLELLRPLLAEVAPPPTLHVLDGADHGFHVLKRSGRSSEEVMGEACEAFSRWVDRLD